jgi:hypothetical protein
MAKQATPRTAARNPEPPDGEAFLEIDAADLVEAAQDPHVRQFAQRADAALRETEQRREVSPPH